MIQRKTRITQKKKPTIIFTTMKRSGTADLPLHYGHVPLWLSERMSRLGRSIITAIVYEYGESAVLSRLSDPFWFQALGCVMGMDWHSSGITTSVMGALKRAINPLSHELGIYICGGRGAYSRNTPSELQALSSQLGLDATSLIRASRLTAKVDNTCIIDGFGIYLHNFILSKNGEWVVIQQGMNTHSKTARRYHWHSASVRSFVDDPHTCIVGENLGALINLSDSRSENARQGIVDFLKHHPDTQLRELKHLSMSRKHEVVATDVNSKRLGAVLATAYEKQFHSFTDALLLEGVGPRTMQSLALVAEVIYGAASRFDDPARFSFAHGGKDGHPFPVPLKTYDESIQILKNAVDKAKIGCSEKLDSLKRLYNFTWFVENNFEPRADVEKVISYERKISKSLNGRTVFDDRTKLHPKNPVKPCRNGAEQLSLFD